MARFLFILLACVVSFSAVAQTPRTRAAMTTEINTNFADNNTGAITPALARSTYLDMMASVPFLNEIFQPPGGRLTLQSHTPVMITTQSNKTTLYYDCYVSNAVVYYNGTSDVAQTIPACEVSTAMQNSGTGVLNSSDAFDVWWSGVNSNICVATNGSGGGWIGDGGNISLRGSGFTVLDRSTRPYTTNKNALTHCYNGATDYGAISANQATYLGSFITNAAGQTTWVFGSAASGGGSAILSLWNMYNRVDVSTNVVDSGTSYTYTTATVREARGSATNIASYFVGIVEDGIVVTYTQQVTTTANAAGFGLFGIGVSSTTSFFGGFFQCFTNAGAVQSCAGAEATTVMPTVVGYNYVAALEEGDGTHAQTFSSNAMLSLKVRM